VPSGRLTPCRLSPPRDVDQLEAAAAQIPCDAVRCDESHQNAERCEFRLALTRQDVDANARSRFGAGDEFRPVLRLAYGRRRDGADIANLEQLADGTEPPQRGKRPIHALVAEMMGAGYVPAQAAQHLLVEHRQRRAARPLVDDEPDRVGADVDDADAPLAERAVGAGNHGCLTVHARPL